MISHKDKKKGKSEIEERINDSFLANVNHAMRTPLNALVGMIELMTKTGLDENQLKYARIMRESTELLMLQLDNILDLANIESSELEISITTCRLEDIVKDSLQHIIPQAVQQKIPLTVIYGPGVPSNISTDSRKVTKILTNLLSCALKFTERGKIIINITRERSKDNARLRFSIQNDKMLYDTVVTDMQKYTDLSTTDLREFGEIAVSLITAKKLLLSLGSSENFDNFDNHRLPLFFELELAEGDDQIRKSSYETLKGKRALILQDESNQINLLLQSLKLWGIEYWTTSNEKMINSELKSAIKNGQPFDLLIFSERHPTIMLDDFGQDAPNCILVSNDFSSLSQSLHIEFAAYLCPPLYPNELLTTLLSFYEDIEPYQEISLSDEASQHICNEKFPPIEAKVMLVEDDFVGRMYASELLESFGCKVAIAENGLHALTKLSSYSDYDIIFMDCMMPRMDGYTATHKIRQNGHLDIPIIALTANSMERDEEKCLASGMTGYVTKPVKEQELYAALKKHIKTNRDSD
ncbi:MAG: response regulator [Methyloligellaceae bacterium]